MMTGRDGVFPRDQGIYLALWRDMFDVVKGGS